MFYDMFIQLLLIETSFSIATSPKICTVCIASLIIVIANS